MTKNSFRPYAAEIAALARPKKPSGRKINLNPKEAQEQAIFVAWMTKNNVLHYAIPNGGSRNAIEAMNLKRQGVKSGVPDICVPIQREPYGGLYIELKRKGTYVVSENQRNWIKMLQDNGQRAEICMGADSAIDTVKLYLSFRLMR